MFLLLFPCVDLDVSGEKGDGYQNRVLMYTVQRSEQIIGTRYVPSTRYQVPGTRMTMDVLMLSTDYRVVYLLHLRAGDIKTFGCAVQLLKYRQA